MHITIADTLSYCIHLSIPTYTDLYTIQLLGYGYGFTNLEQNWKLKHRMYPM